jgi:prepilin-type N-terminal cleavage/methylation domain-containing protein/prepilin-type processing-associated H-X9-DG protein
MKDSGFTLMELLVIIAIIAILLAVFLPSLRSSREHAKSILCVSNIKQLVFALCTYETENGIFPHAIDDTVPVSPPGGFLGNLIYDRAGWWWLNHCPGYADVGDIAKSIAWCPSRKLNDPTFRGNVLCGNYGVNQSICKDSGGRRSQSEFVGTPLRMADIPCPSGTLLVVDSGYAMITWWHAADVIPGPLGQTIEGTAYIPGLSINKDRDFWPGQEWDAIGGRHMNKSVNVGFVDCHILRVEADDLLVKKADELYQNLTPLWLPK